MRASVRACMRARALVAICVTVRVFTNYNVCQFILFDAKLTLIIMSQIVDIPFVSIHLTSLPHVSLLNLLS